MSSHFSNLMASLRCSGVARIGFGLSNSMENLVSLHLELHFSFEYGLFRFMKENGKF